MQVSQETGKILWYSHISESFSQFVTIHTVKGFSVVNGTEVDIFQEFPCFFHDPEKAGNLIFGSFAFLNPTCHLEVFSSCIVEA